MVTRQKSEALAEFAKRLNGALDALGVPPKHKGRQTVVGKMFDVSQKGARKWLEGEGLPDPIRWPEFAAKLNTTVSWLFSLDDYRGSLSEPSTTYLRAVPKKPIRAIPHPDWDTAARSEKLDNWEGRTVQTTEDLGPNAFALTVEGDAMADQFVEGAIIIVDPDITPANGDYVIAIPAGATAPILRRLRTEGGQQLLTANNPRYPALPCASVVATAVSYQISLRKSP